MTLFRRLFSWVVSANRRGLPAVLRPAAILGPAGQGAMTAEPNWDTVDARTDAELVCGSMAGDKAAFAQIYDRYADRLYDFCVGMLRDYDGAADCVQETFCV